MLSVDNQNYPLWTIPLSELSQCMWQQNFAVVHFDLVYLGICCLFLVRLDEDVNKVSKEYLAQLFSLSISLSLSGFCTPSSVYIFLSWQKGLQEEEKTFTT